MRPGITCLLSYALVLTTSTAADPTTTLWYDEPANSWQLEALPIGNGPYQIDGKITAYKIRSKTPGKVQVRIGGELKTITSEPM